MGVDTERVRMAVTRRALERLGGTVARIPGDLVAVYRDAFSGGGLAWASPAVFTVGGYAGFYGIGLALFGPSSRLPVFVLAVSLGLAGLLIGMSLGWRAASKPIRTQPVDPPHLTQYGLLLLVTGLIALVAYFVAIGDIPLFRPDLERSRVVAAEEGGAPLRVLSLLALPGAWLLVAQAAAARDRRGRAMAGLAVAALAVGFALTGNRSPAFTAVEIALITGLLAAGRARLGGRGVAFLALVGLLFVLGAGLFGAFRLASRSDLDGPRSASGHPLDVPTLTGIAIRGYLVVPIQNLGYTMDAVPDRIGWRFGLTYLQPLLTVLPGKQTTFDADLKAALGQQYAGGGTVPGLLGEAFANFGPVGWFVVPMVVGAAITALYRVSQAWSPELAALYAFAIAHVSIGGVLSGLLMASVFPFVAYGALGFAVLGLPIVERWRSSRTWNP